MRLIWSALLLLAACVPAHHGWTRAEVQVDKGAQQIALDKDREACNTEGMTKGVYYQAVMGSLEMTACLERKGWQRVP